MGCCESSFDDDLTDDSETINASRNSNTTYNSTAYQHLPDTNNTDPLLQASPPTPVPLPVDKNPPNNKNKNKNKHKTHNQQYEEVPPAPPSLIPSSHSPPRTAHAERADLLARIARKD